MHRHRTGERGTIPFRSGRYFCINGQWFFTHRDNKLEGPFPDQDSAEQACRRFIEKLKQSQAN